MFLPHMPVRASGPGYKTALCLAGLIVWLIASAFVNTVQAENGPVLEVVGAVQDAHGQGLAGARVEAAVAGQRLTPELQEPLLTDKQGRFHASISLSEGGVAPVEVEVRASKPSWQAATVRFQVHRQSLAGPGKAGYQALGLITLSRQVTPALWLAAFILLAVYLLIATGWLHSALAALLGAALMLFLSYTVGQFSEDFFIMSFEEAMAAMDMNVILLLLGMMLFVGVTKKTGLFPWLAYQSFAWARGRVFLLALLFMWLTALISAFLDNVTTMLLMLPVAVELAAISQIKPVSLLVPAVFAANVGGTATLIGDPANMIIGSSANLTYGAFVSHLTPIACICLVAASGYFLFYYRRDYAQAPGPDVAAAVALRRQRYNLPNRRLLCLCLIVLALMLLFFSLQDLLGMKPAVPALLGAVLLVAVSRVNIAELLVSDIEWPSLLFILSLYIVVAGAAETGLLDLIAQEVRHLIQGDLTLAVLTVLWGSALLSAIIDTIPLTITLLPIVSLLNSTLPGAESGVLWYALALGAGLGGSGTMIGASANVVTVGLATRAGYAISFLDYVRAGFLPMLLTIGISAVYLIIRG